MVKGFAVRTRTAVLGQFALIGLLRPRLKGNQIEKMLKNQRPATKKTALREQDGRGNDAQTTEHPETTLH